MLHVHADDRGSRHQKMKVKTRKWFDVVKGLKIEDELETANSNKSWNKSKAHDSEEVFDSEEPNQLKAKWTRRQRKLDIEDPTSRGARARQEDAWKSRREGPADTDTTIRPQAQLEGEC